MTCDLAASCLCGGENVPADGVLEATITSAFQAQITNVHGSVGAFAIGQTICVDQSVVGASILVPVKASGDAAQVVSPPPLDEGGAGTCVPNYANTLLLDDAGRPLACNAGNESQLALTTQQSVDALLATDCSAALAKADSRWSVTSCAPGSGCDASASPVSGIGALALVTALLALFSFRRGRPRGSRGR